LSGDAAAVQSPEGRTREPMATRDAGDPMRGDVSQTPPSKDRWTAMFLATGAVVVVVGFALTFFGVGADLRAPVPITLDVRAIDVERGVGSAVKAGDAVFSDPMGMRIGTITRVAVSPQTTRTVDASGQVRLAEVPGLEQVDLTIEGQGRQSQGFTALDTQVISIGQRFVVYTKDAFLEADVTSFHVR
jgi:hypothetical protein